MKSIVLLLCMLTCTASNVSAQIKNLVFEGGGVRGIAYIGAIKVLEEKNMLASVENIAGTSVGAITATLLSVGYDAEELKKILTSVKLNKLNDGGGIFIGGSNRLINKFGWYKGDKLTKWMNELLKNSTGIDNLTFHDLHNLSKRNPKFKNLIIMATNLSTQQSQILNNETFPNMRIADAVRISASIPIYYTAVFMDKEGNIYKKQNKKAPFHSVMVDGGFIANYPIHLFDSTFSKNKTVGFMVENDKQVELNNAGINTLASYEIASIRDYVDAFYNIVMENLNRQNITQEDWQRTVSIGCKGIGQKVRKLSKEEIELLIQSGYDATSEYFK